MPISEATLVTLTQLAQQLRTMENPPIVATHQSLRRWANQEGLANPQKRLKTMKIRGILHCSVQWIRDYISDGSN